MRPRSSRAGRPVTGVTAAAPALTAAAALAAGAAALALAACGGQAGSPDPPPRAAADSYALVEVARGLRSPLGLTAPRAGGGREVYVVEQPGTVRAVDRVGRVRARPLLDVRERTSAGGEQGLLGFAFHPDHPRDPRAFAHFTDRRGDTRVIEYRVRDGAADPASARELLAVDQPHANHNGGQLAFGPDGRLHLGLGDGGSAFDPQDRSQDARSRLGKLLALDVDREPPRWEAVAYGLRNPWRFSFDRETGDLWIGDVGQDSQEELDVVPGGRPRGQNFGWPAREGTRRFEDRELRGDGRLVEPVVTYGRDRGCSIVGGHVYRGRAVPALRGRYVYGDFCSGRVWTLRPAGGGASDVREERRPVPQLSSFGEDADGELYAVSLTGVVYRFAPAGG